MNPSLTLKTLGLFIFLCLVSCVDSNQEYSKGTTDIIPKPLSLTDLGAYHAISHSATIYLVEDNEAVNKVAHYLKNQIEQSNAKAALNIKVEETDNPGIHLLLNSDYDNELGQEGYRLNSSNSVRIVANTAAGLFYGVQSLLQLMPVQVFSGEAQSYTMTIPSVDITDRPRYAYRGMHMDPCRHFFSTEATKRFIDRLAYHKLNKFHWHLTEDQGWRIEIKQYPKLAEIASKRKGTIVLDHETGWDDNKYDEIPVEGYFSHEQIREIIQYAGDRHIEVIPEIEMPGHALAALSAYPEFSCNGGPFEVMQKWGVSKDVFCAGNDSTFVFLKNVIDEVAELFPSEYIHIGGDECPKDRWKSCVKCQKRMKDEGLHDEHELQSWFIKEMEKYINSKGKTLVGWSEIMEGGIAPNAVLQSWIGTSAGIEAAKQKHKAIMSPSSHLYFDGIHVDPKYARMEPYGQRYCWTNLEKIYAFNPTPDTLPEEYHEYFIGAEATSWSEYIKTEDHLEYMTLPRISALSEITWTENDLKDYDDFLERLNTQYLRYDQMGVNYRIPHPVVKDTFNLQNEEIEIVNPSQITEVYYTLDGSEPNTNSSVYQVPFKVDSSCFLKAISINKTNRKSSTSSSIIIVE